MMLPHVHTFRRAGRFFAALAALALQLACEPAAAAWIPFNPPAGSRYIVESETKTDDIRSTGNRTALIRSRAEMTVHGRTDDVIGVTYVLRDVTVEGNDPSLPLLRSAMQALRDVPIHTTTDKSGKPTRLYNPGEAEAGIDSVLDGLTVPVEERAQVAAVLRRMLDRLTEGGAGVSAINYLEELPELARAQGDGAPRSSSALSSGFKETISEFPQLPARKLLAAAGSVMTPVQLFIALMEMNFTYHRHSRVQAKDGMILNMKQDTDIKAHAFSYDRHTSESKSVTVTRAP